MVKENMLMKIKKVGDLLDVRSFEVIILMFVITSLKCMYMQIYILVHVVYINF